MELTASNVKTVIMDCLYKENEIEGSDVPKDAVVVEGIMIKLGLHPERLKAHEQDIIDMLGQLPREFTKLGGGGWSFLQACNRQDGTQWGEHPDMDNLFILGQAIGKVKSCMPRDLWSALPGGVPYYMVDL